MKKAKFSLDQNFLRRRILEISYQRNLSHLGSNLSAVDLIYAIYSIKNKDDRFILSSGHAGIALYVVLEKNGMLAGTAIDTLCIHPERDVNKCIDLSTGSLGHGLPIALGMAIANRAKTVYCVSSDGECAEGSIWEALRVARDYKVSNLKIVINANGWGAYDPIDLADLLKRFKGFGYRVILADGHNIRGLRNALISEIRDQPLLIFAKTNVEQFPFLKGLDAHYYVMNESDYKSAMEIL
jgi:transketolase